MTALAVLKGKNIPHGDIRVAFTPDERLEKARNTLTLRRLTRNGPTPLTVAAWVNLSMKTSTRHR